ncbi:MAG: hypothetical protein E7041_02105 [Lentisphaerae bacterium]|nr:hypothetical protein [Lentisphaerota bacterium]
MVQTVEKRIYIRDTDGGVAPFDPNELQTRMIGAFLGAGLREESYISEEIVLALEYTLLTSPRPDGIFTRSEIDTSIVRLLGNTGFPEVANTYRRTASEQVMRLSVSPEVLERLFVTHLGCSAERAAHIAGIVTDNMKTLQIPAASPHLLLELARHHERDLAAQDSLPLPEVRQRSPKVTLSRDEITALLPPAAQQLVAAGVLRINGITTLFPSVRFFFFLTRFAELHRLGNPVTELEIMPLLYDAGNTLETARQAITGALETPEELPCCLALPDISDFQEQRIGCLPDRKLAEELAGALTAGLKCDLYNLSFD